MSRPIEMSGIYPAPAKINLYLHVGAPGADGYHPLSSLVVFGGAADRLRFEPAPRFAFDVEGSWAGNVGGGDDNLVMRAVRAYAEAAGEGLPAVRLTLIKEIPVEAGLGGGSSDAAAALMMLWTLGNSKLTELDLRDIALGLGADVPMCLRAEPVIAEGRGERLSPPPRFPNLYGVLVNPRVACPTPEMFRAYDEAGDFGGEARGVFRPAYQSLQDFVGDLGRCRNDLEPVVRRLRPSVDACLDALSSHPDVLLARLSGSGATSFALCADAAAADRVEAHFEDARPDWWTTSFRIGAPQG